MALLKRLTLGQRGFLCVQYKVEGRTQVHRDYYLQQQLQPLSDPALYHHFIKHLQDHLR